jgi:hypothetical protein
MSAFGTCLTPASVAACSASSICWPTLMDPATVAEKLKNGQVIRGIGIFGRVGGAFLFASNKQNSYFNLRIELCEE